MRHARRGAVGLTAVAALAVAASPAGASGGASAAQATKLQREVDRVLRHSAPGGRQVGPNRVVWPRDGVRLTLFGPGKARAASSSACQKDYACLWQDTNFRSRRVEFFRYRTYRLADWGMPPGKRRGASSWANHQTGGARAILSFDLGWFTMPAGGEGNLPPRRNDAAEFITLTRR
jgi:hypothetical protein